MAQTSQRWSSPGGVGHWHCGQRGKSCDRACIALAQSWKAAFGFGKLSVLALGAAGVSRQLGCSRHNCACKCSSGLLCLDLCCHWAVEKRISTKGLGNWAFNFVSRRWRPKVSSCAQTALEVATHKTPRWIESGLVWAVTTAPTASGQYFSKRWNGSSCQGLCCSRAIKMWLSDLKDMLLRANG